jgi:hypothetical protein
LNSLRYRPFCTGERLADSLAHDPAHVAAARAAKFRAKFGPASSPRWRYGCCGFIFGRYLADFSYTYVTYYAGLASAMTALVFLYFTATGFSFTAAKLCRDRAGARPFAAAQRDDLR